MEVRETAISDVRIITPVSHVDSRGFFSEAYNRRRFAAAGIELDVVQDNHSLTRAADTLRGLHFQSGPAAQAKLVRVLRGRIWDVAVDLRPRSPSFGRHVAVELSAEGWQQLLVPKGFAHGFLTLAPDTEVLYKVDAYYDPDHDHGVRWDDPDLAIPWPLDGRPPLLSSKDHALPRLRDLSPDVLG
jgi:dTDP-4-dehydrorhamnose 3,5-epimerase